MAKILLIASLLGLAGWSLVKESGVEKDRLSGIAAGRTRVLDLSYAISDKLVPWPGDDRGFEAQVKATVERDGYFTRSFWMLEHYGTHMDAPIHFPPGTTPVDKIPVKNLFGPAVVLDVRVDGEKDPDYLLPAARVEEWERHHGRIPAGAIVLLRTGWASRYPDAKRYRNQDAEGTMHFPGFSVEAAKLLVARGVSGLGCDTMSVDPGNSKDFAAHRVTLGAGLYHLENLADLNALPETGAFVIAAPIKLQGGSGGAVRVFAVLE